MDSLGFATRTPQARSNGEGACVAAKRNASTKGLEMDTSVCELLVKAYLSCNQAITAGWFTAWVGTEVGIGVVYSPSDSSTGAESS